MKSLHVQDHTIPMMSGYAFRSRYVVETQRKLGIDAQVVSSARHREFEAPIETIDGLTFHRTAWPQGAMDQAQLKIPFWRERILTRALARRIVEVAKEFKPDVLHAHSPMFNGQAALRAGRALGIPVVYEIRAFWEDDAVDKGKFAEGSFVYKQVRRLETTVCRRAQQVITICDGLRKDLVGRGIPEDKIAVVPNGVDLSRFIPKDPDPALQAKLGLEGKDVIGFIGSFFHYEGLPLLVEAASLLRDRYPNLRLLLVGGGEDTEPTQATVKELGMEDRVLFTGRVPHSEVDSYYSLVELFVYPRLSKRITELVTPLKPLEALAMGKAIMGSDVGGIKELFDDCGVGTCAAAGSAEKLAECIASWAETSPEERAAERDKGFVALKERRTWEGMVGRIIPVYERLTGSKVAPIATLNP